MSDLQIRVYLSHLKILGVQNSVGKEYDGWNAFLAR